MPSRFVEAGVQMYKVGDKVETYKEIQDVTCSRSKVVKGEIRSVYEDVVTIHLDEKWDRDGRWASFFTKDLLATDVLRLKVGDKVKTSWGDVGVVTSLHNKQRGDVSVRLTSHSDSFTYQLEELTKIDDPDEGGQRWSFKSNKDTFDGARIIRELLEAGADYAVVTVDGLPAGLFSTRLARRAEAIGVYTLAGRSWSAGLVGLSMPIGAGLRVVFDESDGPGYRPTTAKSLADLASMVAELEKKEAEAKQFVTHVEWGKASPR